MDIKIYRFQNLQKIQLEFKDVSQDFVIGLLLCRGLATFGSEYGTDSIPISTSMEDHVINVPDSSVPHEYRHSLTRSINDKFFLTQTLNQLSDRWKQLLAQEINEQGQSGRYTCYVHNDRIDLIYIFDDIEFLRGVINALKFGNDEYAIHNLKLFDNYKLCNIELATRERLSLYNNENKEITSIMVDLLPDVLCNIVCNYCNETFTEVYINIEPATEISNSPLACYTYYVN